jgi:hypothetical protein
MEIFKYPRTPHLETSSMHGDDFLLNRIQFSALQNQYVIYEYKIDGANSAISFSEDKQLLIQSRGHYLRGGAREKEFSKTKLWANLYINDLYDVLGKRYIMFGESMYAKHTIFYDKLPHYFLEFDVFDKENNIFLSTKKRKALLEGLAYCPVPIAYEGYPISLEHLKSFIGYSVYKTESWKDNLKKATEDMNLDYNKVVSQTDMSDLDEGIYVKIETEDQTIGRAKFVRKSFVEEIIKQDSHWHDRPIIPNKLIKREEIWSF